jgi:hypothetical protein
MIWLQKAVSILDSDGHYLVREWLKQQSSIMIYIYHLRQIVKEALNNATFLTVILAGSK